MKPKNHKNLFNADCNAWVYKYHPKSRLYRSPEQRLTAQDIHKFVGVLAESGVDTLVMNCNAQEPWYPSKKLHTPIDGYKRGDKSYFFGHIIGWDMTPEYLEHYLDEASYFMDKYLDWIEAGVDWLAETAKACRQKNISPWVSIRMNDMHGATKYIEASYMNSEIFKNPAMRLRGVSYNPETPLQRGWQGLNFEKKEVRDFTFAIIADPVENYDYEGLELDWTRAPLCCEPDASQATIDMITEWHAEIRKLTKRQAEKTGKPYPLGIRYAGTFDQLRSIGIDIRAMAKEGIYDFICPTNTWQTSWDIPCDELKKEFGPDVAVYGVIELGTNWLHGFLPNQKKGNPGLGKDIAVDYRLSSMSAPIMRGNSASKLVLGVDGIETFNFFCADTSGHWPWQDEECVADYSSLKKLEDMEYLRSKEKFYTFPSQIGYYSNPVFETITPFPAMLGPMERKECRLPMISEPASSGLEFVIQVVVEKKEKLPAVGIYFNGAWPKFDYKPDEKLLFPIGPMTHHIPDNVGLNFSFSLSCIREGWNDIVVMNGTPKDWVKDQKQDYVNVQSVELAVRKK